jgi:hypothetical protein
MSNTSSPKKAEKRHNNPALQVLMRLVNSVPADVKLPQPKANWKEILGLLKSKDFEKYRKLTGPMRRRRIFDSDSPLTSNRIFGQYEILRFGRQWLQTVATIGANLRKLPVLQTGCMKWVPPPLPHRSFSMYTDKEGLLRFSLFPLVAAFVGVRVMTLRNCEICRKFFLARRKDQPCCTRRCAHTRRTRRSREKYLQSYKQNRFRATERKQRASQGLDKNDFK